VQDRPGRRQCRFVPVTIVRPRRIVPSGVATLCCRRFCTAHQPCPTAGGERPGALHDRDCRLAFAVL